MLIDDVKLALRITANDMDDDLKGLINAAKADMRISGVKIVLDTDPLVIQAVKLYCKGHFGDSDSSEKFLKAYEALKISMSLAGEFRG